MTAQQYFDEVQADRKGDIELVRQLIKSVFPKAEETMAYKLPTYVIHNEALVSLASQKNYMALYICHYDLLEHFKDQLSAYNCGKSCIRFKKLKENSLETFKEILKYVNENHQSSKFSGKMIATKK